MFSMKVWLHSRKEGRQLSQIHELTSQIALDTRWYILKHVSIHNLSRNPQNKMRRTGRKRTLSQPSHHTAGKKSYTQHEKLGKMGVIVTSTIPSPSPATILLCPGPPGALARDCHKAYVPTVANVAEPTMRQDGQSSYFELGCWSLITTSEF
jgi:hypothetical protein